MSSRLIVTAAGVTMPTGVIGDAILVEDGVVAAVGTRVAVRAAAGKRTAETSFDGYIVPGLRDSHLHPVAYTALLTGVALHQVRALDELTALMRSAAERGEPLVGWNLNEATLAEQRLPTRHDLDAVSSELPVMVHRYDGHLAIVNSVALRIAGVEGSTPNPAGGVIDRDASGTPTGVLRETAIDLVAGAEGVQNPVDPRDLAECMRALASRGITSIGAMVRSGDGPWSHLGDEVATLVAAAESNPIRLNCYVTAPTTEDLRSAVDGFSKAGSRLSWAGVKRFGDGSFGAHTAAMAEPFADAPAETGTLRLNSTDAAMARLATAADKGVAIHAIGDAAASAVLDLFGELIDAGAAPHLLRMEHASVLSEADIARIGRFGAVASVQPAFLGSEVDWIESRVGPDRLQRTYAFASLMAAGALLVGGSDAPVEAPDPWEAMALCRDRAGLVPSQAISAGAALAMYTTNAAKAMAERPPLGLGSPADFIVVDRNPLSTTPDALRATEVVATYVGGARIDMTDVRNWWID